MKYFNFKRLNKERKFLFILHLIYASFEISVGIFMKNLSYICFGLFVFISGLQLFNNQSADNIIENYECLVKCQRDIFKNNLELINLQIKNKDVSRDELSKIIDEYINKEEKDAINS